MLDHQLYLLASVFATRRDAKQLKRLLIHYEARQELYDAVCVLWPEMDDPTHLRFLFDSKCDEDLNGQDLLVQLVGGDDKLIPIVEMDHNTILERTTVTKQYVKSRLADLKDIETYQLTNIEAKWMRRRMLLCNRFRPQHAALYKPLWDLVEKDSVFLAWIHGIIEPLEHINKRLGLSISIEKFEQMDPSQVFEIILKSESEFHTTVINREIIPFLTNNNLYNLFLDRVFSKNNFPLDSDCNLRIFHHLLTELLHSTKEAQYHSQIQSRAAEIIFENSSNVLITSGSSELSNLLSSIDDNIQVENYTIKVARLKHYAECIQSVYKRYNLEELYSISQEGEESQLAQFSSIVREHLLSNNTNRNIADTISLLMDVMGSEDAKVFTRLSSTQKASAFIETALELGKFDLLNEFLVKFNSNVDEDVLVKYFWHFFNKASNGLSTRPEMRNAQKTLKLLNTRSKHEHNHMTALLEVANELSKYSLNLGKGVPFKPSDILDFNSKPLELISLLLELNPDLYTDIGTTVGIFKKLKIGLQNKTLSSELSDEEYASILALHIDHSLANMDFNFALDKTKKLLKLDHISIHWPTIFQVGKFIDPLWPDGEAPVDILAVQMDILGDLLHVCPVEESEAIVSQWSALELELITRDPINAHYSEDGLEESSNSLQANVLLNGVSSKFTSLLSGSRR